MGYRNEELERKEEEREIRKRIVKETAKINKTPSRVTVSDSTKMPEVVIHRIPLKLFTKDRLGELFWIVAIPLGFVLLKVGENSLRSSELAIVPRQLIWIGIGIPMGAFLWYGILLLRFLHRYRPIRIRLQGDTFYFDFPPHAAQWTGKLTKNSGSLKPLELSVNGGLTHSPLTNGWVTLDIALRGSRKINVLASKAYRLKFDDARKLIAFARANNLPLLIATEVSHLLRRKVSSPELESD